MRGTVSQKLITKQTSVGVFLHFHSSHLLQTTSRVLNPHLSSDEVLSKTTNYSHIKSTSVFKLICVWSIYALSFFNYFPFQINH